MKKRTILYLSLLLLLAACSEDAEQSRLTQTAYDLIGHAVKFTTSRADLFTTRTSYRADGSFNEGDIMYIYRQYSDDGGGTFESNTMAYRVYALTTKYITGTTFALETDWHPVAGATGHNPDGDITQTEADSLTWENGKTVRFRAWSRSNYAGVYDNGTRQHYYPDYSISEWVTVSGPTLDVPLTLKHQGCRIGFTQKAGNEFYKAEICTDWKDYKRTDNADTSANDEASSEHSKTDAEAQAECELVNAVYNKMCMPAGVDTDKALLSTMTKTLYETTTDFKTIHTKTATDGIVTFGAKDADDIAKSVQRPVFADNNGNLFMVTIPYDMSSASTQGESLVLPACTRFKIWLRDVNNGDGASTPGTEGTYHIFSLSDVRDPHGTPLFPNGMDLKGGYSYLFSVGYHYDHFTITPADNFSWDEQDAESGTAKEQVQPLPTNGKPYQWWKEAISAAIPKNNTERYNPDFHIADEAAFVEFIHLVNGTAVNAYVQANPLTRLPNPDSTFATTPKPNEYSKFRWYYSSQCQNGKLKPSVKTADSLSHEAAGALGYIFYDHYHSANADQAAYTSEDYLQTAYSFYDENLSRHFTVHLDADLDLKDWQLPSIGATSSTPFRGVFDGYVEAKTGDAVTAAAIHSLKNAYFENGGYMFRYCKDAAIRNLRIETTHPFMLVDTAEAQNTSSYGAYIVGISIYAPTTVNPIARTLTGSSYVVGCLYQGHATGAMVGTANNLYMYGNMMAATGLTHSSGALLGSYADNGNQFFAPQAGQKLAWGRFMGNYYLMGNYHTDSTKVVQAVGNIVDKYRPQEYIRGGLSWVLKQKNDNMLTKDVPYERLTSELMRKGYYGLAPWKVMNYAIKIYNDVGATVAEAHNCKGHFVNDNDGYAHVFPHMEPGEPNSTLDATGLNYTDGSINILEMNN